MQCRQGDSDPRPLAYDAIALPLSYAGWSQDFPIKNVAGAGLEPATRPYESREITRSLPRDAFFVSRQCLQINTILFLFQRINLQSLQFDQ